MYPTKSIKRCQVSKGMRNPIKFILTGCMMILYTINPQQLRMLLGDENMQIHQKANGNKDKLFIKSPNQKPQPQTHGQHNLL